MLRARSVSFQVERSTSSRLWPSGVCAASKRSRRLPSALEPEDRLGGVLEREALRRLEGDAEARMGEAAAADHAVGRIVPVGEPVERRRR